MAELADALGSGPSARKGVQVQVLSSVFFLRLKAPFLSGLAALATGNASAVLLYFSMSRLLIYLSTYPYPWAVLDKRVSSEIS